MAHPPHDALFQQVAQGSVNRGVRLAQDERHLSRVNERRPAEGIEQLSFGDRHVLRVAIERPGGQPSSGSASVEQTNESIDSCVGTRYNQFMIRSFRHRRLRRLYERDDPSRIANHTNVPSPPWPLEEDTQTSSSATA